MLDGFDADVSVAGWGEEFEVMGEHVRILLCMR
jgi:hypothetical protein